ncbi:hypothetical protein CN332_04430 [Bacillus thuringiensis]|nr:hypothetical protein CN332_04430 [Bacillus thuringiensis]PFF69741.1 hypothetical protein CN339_28385 [Bacillus thuringiensis]
MISARAEGVWFARCLKIHVKFKTSDLKGRGTSRVLEYISRLQGGLFQMYRLNFADNYLSHHELVVFS